MLTYYFLLGLRSLKRNPVLTALMIFILAIGVAASVSTLTVLHVMSGDPIPNKSSKLFIPILNNSPLEGYVPGQGYNDHQATYRDVMNLMESGQGVRRTGLYRIGAVIEAPRKDVGVLRLTGLAATKDVFAMFDVPFLFGQAWRDIDDKKSADVVILSKKTSEKLFGKDNPVGKHVRMLGSDFQIIGVHDNWIQRPRFYSYLGRGSAFGEEEEFIIPLSSAIRHEASQEGNMSCQGDRNDPSWQSLLDSECTWFHFWFELENENQRGQLQEYIDRYVSEQYKLGRFVVKDKNLLFNVREWLSEMKIVSNDSKISAWLALGFLMLCLINAAGLLLAKFSSKSAEIGVRRALGASKQQIFAQYLIETTVIGLVGAFLGVVLALGALELIGMQAKYLAVVAKMDWIMLSFTFVLSVAAAILAGLMPTWRACQVTPAIQLKSQ